MNRERRIEYETIAQGQLSGIRMSAPSAQRLFIDAALALSDYRIASDLVKDTQKQNLTVKGDTLEALLRNWLNAVADLFNRSAYLPYRIVFTSFDGKQIQATLTGETYESPRHGYPRPFKQLAAHGLDFTGRPDDAGVFHVSFLLE